MEMVEFAVTCGIHSIEMSEKNVMLTDTAIALLIGAMRVLANPALIDKCERAIKTGQAIIQSKAEFLALKLPGICAKLAIEDEMPGKLFAL